MDFLDVFLGSKELKRTIVKLSVQHSLPLRYMCQEIGLEYRHFMDAYINSSEHTSFVITEKQAKRLLEMLGVSVRMQFIIDSNHDYKKVQDHLKMEYGYRSHDKEKARVGIVAESLDTVFGGTVTGHTHPGGT